MSGVTPQHWPLVTDDEIQQQTPNSCSPWPRREIFLVETSFKSVEALSHTHKPCELWSVFVWNSHQVKQLDSHISSQCLLSSWSWSMMFVRLRFPAEKTVICNCSWMTNSNLSSVLLGFNVDLIYIDPFRNQTLWQTFVKMFLKI